MKEKKKSVLERGLCRGEMSHLILAAAMKLDSVILAQPVWSPCEMSKLKFRLNSMYQSCQNKMFTPCWYLSQRSQLTGLLHSGCEAILIHRQALLLFFPLHHLMCSSYGQVCKHH